MTLKEFRRAVNALKRKIRPPIGRHPNTAGVRGRPRQVVRFHGGP